METLIVIVIIAVYIHYRWTRPSTRGRVKVRINRRRGW